MRQSANFRRDAKKIAISDEGLWNQSLIDYVEFINMLDTADAVAISALEREDSLGAHIRLDGGTTSVLFEKAYSLFAYFDEEMNFRVGRLSRPPTPWKRVLIHVLRDRKRKLGMKFLRLLPVFLQDRILEKRYHAVMGDVELDHVKPESVKVPQEIEREAA